MTIILTAILSGLFSGLIVHFFTLRRDRLQSRRDMYTKYLIDAYNVISSNAERHDKSFDAQKFEDAISVIQLFGNETQINLALEVAKGIVEKKKVHLVSLLTELRKSLRGELGLQETNLPIKILRFNS